jgi:hypothetical protein
VSKEVVSAMPSLRRSQRKLDETSELFLSSGALVWALLFLEPGEDCGSGAQGTPARKREAVRIGQTRLLCVMLWPEHDLDSTTRRSPMDTASLILQQLQAMLDRLRALQQASPPSALTAAVTAGVTESDADRIMRELLELVQQAEAKVDQLEQIRKKEKRY